MRKAFTLIELLAVMFIIAILVGILMPAVSAVREAGKRTQCITYQKNLAVGLLNYENTRGNLPGWRDYITVKIPQGTPPGAMPNQGQPGMDFAAQVSWVFCILPHIEQMPLFDSLKAGQVNADGNTQIPSIDILRCPSDPESPQSRATNYVVNGGAVDDFSSTDGSVTSDGNIANGPFLDRASIIAYDPNNLNKTPRFDSDPKHAVVRISDISKFDGAAHTLLTSENSQRGYWISEHFTHFYNNRSGRTALNGTGLIQLNDERYSFTLTGHEDTIEGSVAFCWYRVRSGGSHPYSYPPSQPGYLPTNNPFQGFLGVDSNPGSDVFTAPAPPFPADAVRTPIFPGLFNRKTSFDSWYQSARPSSYHAGVIIASFCDGNVSRISTESLSETVFVQLMTVGDAQSDAGVGQGNFLYGKLFNSKGL